MLHYMNTTFTKTAFEISVFKKPQEHSFKTIQNSVIFNTIFVWGIICFHHFRMHDLKLINVFILSFLLRLSWSWRCTLRSETNFGTWKPFRKDEKCFLFDLAEALSLLTIFKFLSWLFGHVEISAWLER